MHSWMVYSGKMDTPAVDQTQDSAPLSPTPMNAAFKIVIVLLVISLLAVSLIFAYFFSQRKSWKVPEETMAPVASPMVDAATPDLMPDWKTYTDPKITFQHPADWYIAPGQIISLTSYDPKVSTIPENGTKMEISQTTQTQNELETFVQQRLSDYSMSSFVSDPKLKAVSDYKIGNLSTQEIVMQQAITSRYTQELYASLNSTETISVVVYNGASHGASIKQILSTFTFIK